MNVFNFKNHGYTVDNTLASQTTTYLLEMPFRDVIEQFYLNYF